MGRIRILPLDLFRFWPRIILKNFMCFLFSVAGFSLIFLFVKVFFVDVDPDNIERWGRGRSQILSSPRSFGAFDSEFGIHS